MGCGASAKSRLNKDDTVTSVRDLAPLEVADTGGRLVRYQTKRIENETGRRWMKPGATTLPGVVSEAATDINAEAKNTESLIQRHPPKKPPLLRPETEAIKEES